MKTALLCLALAASVAPADATSETYRLGFEDPAAVAVGSDGSLFVLDAGAGMIRKVARRPEPRVVSSVGEIGEGRDHFLFPSDVAVGKGGELVVADAGNYRLAKFSPSGSFLKEVRYQDWPRLERVVAAPDGGFRVLLWDGRRKSLEVRGIDSELRPTYSFSIDTTCSERLADAGLADLAVDRHGDSWVVGRQGCEDQYTLRKFSSEGEVLGSWIHPAGQISLDAQRKHGFMAAIVSAIFVDGDRVYVVLGAGGAQTGGLSVDIFSTDGTFLRRSKIVGPATPRVRVTAYGGTAFVVDRDGLKAVVAIELSGL